MTGTEAKTTWRRFFKSEIENFLNEHSANADEPSSVQAQLTTNLKDFLKGQADGIWGAYHALPSEASVHAIAPILKNEGGAWAFPRIQGETLTFHQVDQEDQLIPGPFGIYEPDAKTCPRIPVQDLKGVLIPGLGFDQSGTRLGRGKGFYDRALENYNGLKAGVAWSCQVTNESLPQDEFDLKVDVVISDREVKWISKKEKTQ